MKTVTLSDEEAQLAIDALHQMAVRYRLQACAMPQRSAEQKQSKKDAQDWAKRFEIRAASVVIKLSTK